MPKLGRASYYNKRQKLDEDDEAEPSCVRLAFGCINLTIASNIQTHALSWESVQGSQQCHSLYIRLSISLQQASQQQFLKSKTSVGAFRKGEGKVIGSSARAIIRCQAKVAHPCPRRPLNQVEFSTFLPKQGCLRLDSNIVHLHRLRNCDGTFSWCPVAGLK